MLESDKNLRPSSAVGARGAGRSGQGWREQGATEAGGEATEHMAAGEAWGRGGCGIWAW